MNIIKKNKLIAKFMGLETNEELKYNSSWDWLMPAIHKFDNIYEDALFNESESDFYTYYCAEIDETVTLYEIQLAFEALVNALDWFMNETFNKQNECISEEQNKQLFVKK